MLGISNTGVCKNRAVCRLSGEAVLTGVFMGSFHITAYSLFLSMFDEKILARAFIFSGIAGLLLLYAHYKSVKKIRRVRLDRISLSLISILTLILWVLLIVNPSGPVIKLVFIMSIPLNVLIMPGISGESVQYKDKINGISLPDHFYPGVIVGIMAAGFMIPLLVTAGLDVRYCLVLSFISVVATLFIQLIRTPRNNFIDRVDNPQPDENKQEKEPLRVLTGDHLFRMIAFFILISVITFFSIQYSFLAVTRIHYPLAEDMAHFLGLFTGCLMIFALLLGYFVFPYLARNIGLRATIAVPPVILTILIICMVIAGFTAGDKALAAGINVFFILLALSTLFSGAFKSSIEYPSISTFIRLLDKDLRVTANMAITGPVGMAGTLFSGLILTAAGIPVFMKLERFPLVLVIITVLWLISAVKLCSVYRRIISRREESSLKNERLIVTGDDDSAGESRLKAETDFENDLINLLCGEITSLEKEYHPWYVSKILDYAEIRREINLLPALTKIRSVSEIPRDIRLRTSGIIKDLELLSSGLRQNDEKLRAMMILAGEKTPPVHEVLKLIRERDTDLRVIALGIIRKFGLNELLPEVCSCLENPLTMKHAENVLQNFRSDADQALRRYHLFSSGNPEVSGIILRILGRNCNVENTEFLFSLLWSSERSTREAALQSLASCNYKISPEEKNKLLRLITDIVGILTWNLAAAISMGKTVDILLKNALLQENRRWSGFLFNLLSVVYGNMPVNKIKENLEEGTLLSVSYALEMMGILFDHQVKARLMIIFDLLPDRRKLRNLFRFYPGQIPEYKDLAWMIINRDYNLMGVWLRACMLRIIPRIDGNEMAESIIALLFSPELILRQETAGLLSRTGGDHYRQASDRIPEELKESIEMIINGKVKEQELIFNKVKFLVSLLKKVPEEDLLNLAGELNYSDFLSPDNLPGEGGYILWECNPLINECRTEIFYDNILRRMSLKEAGTFYYVLPLNALIHFINLYPEHSFEILKYINETERRNR